MKLPEKQPESGDIKEVASYRKKRRRTRLVRRIVLLASVVLCVSLVWIYRDVIFEPLRGIGSKINTTTTNSEGFPVDLTAGLDYDMMPLSDGFALLNDTYLYSYNGAGGQYYAHQHGYVNPVAHANSKRVLIYDKGGTDFALYSKTSEIYKQSVEDEVIVSAFIGQNEQVAVVTSAGRYSNVVYIYDGNGKWLYTHRFIDDNVMQAAFSPDDRYLYLTHVASDNGDIVTKLTKYELGNEIKEVWSNSISDCISLEISIGSNNVCVAADTVLYRFDDKTGKLEASSRYSDEIVDFSISQGVFAYAFNDYITGGSRISLYDDDCKLMCELSVTEDIIKITTDGSAVFVLTEHNVYKYDLQLRQLSQIKLSGSYSDFMPSGGRLLLIGYDSVEQISI